MRTTVASLAALALASVSSASGTIDNTEIANLVTNAAVQFTGQYHVTSVKSGKSMYFVRDAAASQTNLELGDASETIQLDWISSVSDSTGTYSGVRISGLTKCASSQWDLQGSASVGDQYAASYACAVGSDQTSTSDLHVAKQVWSFIPCGSSSSSTDDDDSSSASSDDTKEDVVLASTSSPSSSSSSADEPDCKYDQQGAYQHMNSTGVYTKCKNKIKLFEDRHPELAPFYTPTTKRSLHKRRAEEMKRKLAKRTTTQYCIIPQDHLADMTATVIEASMTETYGGYTGLVLGHYTGADSVTEAMLWTVTEA